MNNISLMTNFTATTYCILDQWTDLFISQALVKSWICTVDKSRTVPGFQQFFDRDQPQTNTLKERTNYQVSCILLGNNNHYSYDMKAQVHNHLIDIIECYVNSEYQSLTFNQLVTRTHTHSRSRYTSPNTVLIFNSMLDGIYTHGIILTTITYIFYFTKNQYHHQI